MNMYSYFFIENSYYCSNVESTVQSKKPALQGVRSNATGCWSSKISSKDKL